MNGSTYLSHSLMRRKQTTPKYTPHVRYWQSGQISVSAKTRIELLIEHDRQREASTMISEWVIK